MLVKQILTKWPDRGWRGRQSRMGLASGNLNANKCAGLEIFQPFFKNYFFRNNTLQFCSNWLTSIIHLITDIPEHHSTTLELPGPWSCNFLPYLVLILLGYSELPARAPACYNRWCELLPKEKAQGLWWHSVGITKKKWGRIIARWWPSL